MRCVCIFGPTGVGKTDLLVELFGGQGTAEVVSADSMQVYRGMDIGTAKPSSNLRRDIPHHLIDIRNPDEQYHAGDFVDDAERAIREIGERGHLPVVSGGTAFYFRNLIYGLPGTPTGDPKHRAELYRRLEAEGIGPLVDELAAVDPTSAARIPTSDAYRIVRALEVFHASGKPLSAFPVPREPRRDLRALVIGLSRDAGELRRRIDRRVAAMFAAGLVDEVARLTAAGYRADDPGMRGIGYRELLTDDETIDIDVARDLIALHTRQYAKRQLTFFRSLGRTEWIDMTARTHAAVTGVVRGLIDGFASSGE